MNVISEADIKYVRHYMPLHYLCFIARAQKLLSKEKLRAQGFEDKKHFRSSSRGADCSRGFGDYVFLTLSKKPDILEAKLKKGFPHIELKIKSEHFDGIDFDLCRYNIARCRTHKAGDGNGSYYPGKKIPIARKDHEKSDLIKHNYPQSHIEVLVQGELELPNDLVIGCYHQKDCELASRVIRETGVNWEVVCLPEDYDYEPAPKHFSDVKDFLEKCLSDRHWKGDGLEFDKL